MALRKREIVRRRIENDGFQVAAQHRDKRTASDRREKQCLELPAVSRREQNLRMSSTSSGRPIALERCGCQSSERKA